MQIKYRQLLESVPYFRELNEMEFMPRTALNLSKLIKQLDSELASFNAIRDKIIDKYKEVPEDKGEAAKQQENSNAEFNELLDTEVELNVQPIPFEAIERTGRNVKPSAMIALDWLIQMPEEENQQTALVKPDIIH